MPGLNTTRTGSASVFTMHGVVAGLEPDTCAHRGLFEPAQFVKHLRSRKTPYVELAAALRGEGDALTIDDATFTACDAAALAREHGHHVTLFINPGNVAAGETYFFVLLNLVLDRTTLPRLTLGGRDFPLRTTAERRELREYFKRRLLTLAGEADRRELVHAAARQLGVADLSVPRPLQTVGVDVLRELGRRQVNIANHGWTHGSVGALPADHIKQEIIRGREWINRELGQPALAYAVPFGQALPPFSANAKIYEIWLTSHELLHDGFIGPHVFNRTTLRLG
ncbi:MAG TPA: polysaccharide deacetylase family protein [Opitutales bacterium]|nr:polysaccharide deacetylase family protein [Opitutales bacterium]